ncbi:MAG TPA: isocitrate/isopropylmalate family dehydrogenase, partial [Anaerolineaceae bacterium]
MASHRICILPGDGIGPEVIEAAVAVLNALGLDLEYQTGEIGFAAYQKLGTPLPEQTLELVRASQATLFGAVTTPPNLAGYRSPILRLRKELDLYANFRPSRSLPGSFS